MPAVAVGRDDGLRRALPAQHPGRARVLVWRAADQPPATVQLHAGTRVCDRGVVAATRVVTLTCELRTVADVSVWSDGARVALWRHVAR